ncbi:MAG: NAD(P)H-dependent oxidoreductase subunit E [Treponema sp.]|jgi:NADH-quinone oxidoreductase subunit E|nr:NAD(P)H-dependent oxidoreductase subunit E [Treponema sp.]
MADKKSVFSPELRQFIDDWKSKKGNLIMILHRVQEEMGYISNDAVQEVANLTGLPVARIHGVVSFYSFFRTTPPGRNQITVCLGTACYLKGGQELLDEIHRILNLKADDILTSDGQFSVESVRCIGCCGMAPVISINGEVYGRVVKEQIPQILAKYQK